MQSDDLFAVATLAHPAAVGIATALVSGATSLIGVWVRASRARYLRYWASVRLSIARILAFAAHAGIGLVAWKLAKDYGWVPEADGELWFLNALAYAAAAEAAFRADWTGLWLESVGPGFSFVRGFDRLLGKFVGARAALAEARVVEQLGDRRLISEAARLMTNGFGIHPSDPVGVALWSQLADNIAVIDEFGPLGQMRTFDQEKDLVVAHTAVVRLVLDRIEAQDDLLGSVDGRARNLVSAIQLTRPSKWWTRFGWFWP